RRPKRVYSRPRLEELESRRLLSDTPLFRSAIPIALSSSQPETGVISQAPTYYDFTVEDAGRLTAVVTPRGGATRLRLLSSDGQTLVQSDGQSADNPDDLIDLHVEGSRAGTTYYLVVQGLGGAAGTYQLKTSFTTASPLFQPLSVGALSRGRTFDLN